MSFSGNHHGNFKRTIVLMLALWLFSGLAISGSAHASSGGKGSTFDSWWKNQRNPFYGGRNWNTAPEWIKQKGPAGVPNPRSGSTGGDFVSGVAKTPGYKPGGSVPEGPGVGQATSVYDDWLKAGNKPNVPAGPGVRPPESVPGVAQGSSAGSGWVEQQQKLGAGGKATGTTPGPGEPIYPIGRRLTPFKPGQKLPTGEGKAIYEGSGIPHRAPPSGASTAGPAGKAPGQGPKSGGSVIGKVFIGLMAINSAVNIATSDNPGEQAKEEGRGWFTGIIGNIMGGLITGGPIGGFIGAVIGITATDKNFADYVSGNDQNYQDQQAREKLTGTKTLEGEQRVGLENLKKNLPGGFGPMDITPPGTQTAAGTADIGNRGVPAGEGRSSEGISPGSGPMGITSPVNQTAAGTADIGTSGVSTSGGQAVNGPPSGLDWAQNINVTKSYKDGQRSKSKSKAKENLNNSGLTTSERVTAGEAEDQRKKGQISSQGQETGQNISNTQQEGKKAQDTDRIMSETSIGTILAGGLMGGLSAGVATGLDGFFGTLGQGAGGQVSVNAGIQPPPPPNAEPASGSGASAGTGSSSGTGATTTTATSGGSGKSAGVSGSSGTGASKGIGASSETATSGVTGTTAPTSKQTTKVTKPTTTATTTTATVTKPTTAATKPTTSATKPTTTGVSKPDCSQYRISAQDLSSQYERGLIATSEYKVQMNILRTKYKGCQDTVNVPTTSGTSKTSNQGSAKKKPEGSSGAKCYCGAPADVWHCHGYTGSCCTKGWACLGNACGALDPGVYKATHDCMKKLGLIR